MSPSCTSTSLAQAPLARASCTSPSLARVPFPPAPLARALLRTLAARTLSPPSLPAQAGTRRRPPSPALARPSHAPSHARPGAPRPRCPPALGRPSESLTRRGKVHTAPYAPVDELPSGAKLGALVHTGARGGSKSIGPWSIGGPRPYRGGPECKEC